MLCRFFITPVKIPSTLPTNKQLTLDFITQWFWKFVGKTNNTDSELLKDMLFDWSHVRDSSDEAFLAMAMEINKCLCFTEAKSADSMLDFKIFVANYFQDLRRELDYYVNMEPDATSEIDRIDEELYYETQI